MLRVLHAVGLDSTRPVTVKGVEVVPRDLVAAITPDPAKVGERMKGRAIVGTWAIGRKDGKPREVYVYQKTVGEEIVGATHGLQAVAFQTGFNPVVGMELRAAGDLGSARRARPRAARPRSVPGGAGPQRHPLGGRGAHTRGRRSQLTRRPRRGPEAASAVPAPPHPAIARATRAEWSEPATLGLT